MTVHMFRIVAASESTDTGGMTLSEINSAMDDWMSKQSRWEADPTEHVVTLSEPIGDGTSHYTGNYRLTFDSETKDNLLQKLGDKLKKKLDWYRIGYHQCDHDESSPTGCSWDDEREWTSKNTDSIPSDVPDFL